MLAGAARRARRLRFARLGVVVRKADVLASGLPDGSADCIIAGFGLKTLSAAQQEAFAAAFARLLRPGGTFTLVEVSVPPNALLRRLCLVYLKAVIPLIGALFLGNPRNYQMLGVYTEHFGDCRAMRDRLARQGLVADYRDYFFGCATGVSGQKAGVVSSTASGALPTGQV